MALWLQLAVFAVLLCSTHNRIAEAMSQKDGRKQVTFATFPVVGRLIDQQVLDAILTENGIDKNERLQNIATQLKKIVFHIEGIENVRNLRSVTKVYRLVGDDLTKLLNEDTSVKDVSKHLRILGRV